MKRKRAALVSLPLSLLAAVSVNAVEPTEVAEAVDALITDRPDFTESTQTIPRGRMQLEGGATFTRRGSSRETGIGELLLRVAAGKRSELRLGANSYVVQRAPGSRTSGKDDVSLGLKVRLRDSETTSLLAPRVSLIVQTSVPSGARALREDKWQPGAKLLFGWDVNEKTGFAANLNYDYASEAGQRFGQVSASASVGYSVSERTGAFLETYALFPGSAGGENETFVDTGLTYLLSPDFQLDARVGLGIGNNVGSDYFFGVGAARRF
ncbi:MAG TPA: transporter [Abditibacteriaceae bacterium]|jgi:hypothetical protein